jgi:transposase
MWRLIIEGVRYRRQAIGYKRGGIWTVNPAWTSQTCSVCGNRGFRVEHRSSLLEKKGGEFFYYPQCEMHLHADINAARNTVKVIQMPSAASGRTSVST